MNKVFLTIDKDTTLEELEKIIKYNIGRASIVRDNIKFLDKAEEIKNTSSSSKQDDCEELEITDITEDIDEEKEDEYLYYYHNIIEQLKNDTKHSEILDIILDNLPSCENKNYLNIVNRIKLELLKQIYELDTLLNDDDIKCDIELTNEIVEEKAKIYAVIEAINYVQTEKKESQIEKVLTVDNKLIFLETPGGSIYAESDLYSISEEYYESFMNLLISIKNGTFKNVKMLNGGYKLLVGISEVKDFKTRIIFDQLGKNAYVIIGIFTKKCNTDTNYREFLVNRVSYYRKQKQYLKEMINDEDFVEKNKDIANRVLKGLAEKNLVKTIKGDKYE